MIKRITRKVISFNRHISMRLYEFFPQSKLTRERLAEHYNLLIKSEINEKKAKKILDIGAGQSCPFKFNGHSETTIVGVDIDFNELAKNRDVTMKIVADSNKKFLRDKSCFDIITSRMVLEHLSDLNSFFDATIPSLNKNGKMIHIFPAKFALFSQLNRLLPRRLSRYLLNLIMNQMPGLGFDVFYNKCTFSEITDLIKSKGLEINEVKISYQQTDYFAFFTPLFLLLALYEMFLYLCNVKKLCGYILVVAQKKDAEDDFNK